jgi:catechol 2,3-dioxygenase-like lactoylglutathione lyase family enzyme
MISHVSLAVRELARAIAFYDAALEPLGYVRVGRGDAWAGYGARGPDEQLTLFARDDAAAPGPGVHLALVARDAAAVDAFHAAALAAGGRDDGAPGPRPRFGPGYYAAFVRDPDGNKLEAVFHAEP